MNKQRFFINAFLRIVLVPLLVALVLTLIVRQIAETPGGANAADAPYEYSNNQTPRFFEDRAELDTYIELYRTHQKSLPVVFIASENGMVNLSNPLSNPRYDCDDYARDFVLKALEDGYIVYEVPLKYGMLYEKQVGDYDVIAHSGNLARAGNAYYYIETSPGRNRWNIVKVTELD